MTRNTQTPASLPETGFLRLAQVLKLLPLSKATWYEGVKAGRFPQPIRVNRRLSLYRVEDIRALFERLGSEERSDCNA